MKQGKLIFFILIFILSAVVGLSLFFYEDCISNYKFNNEMPLSQINNQQYTEQEIEKLEQDIFAGNITVKKFIRRYKPQCIRKTSQGYYAVLMQNNNVMCFVFWDNKDNLCNIYKTAKFLPYEELQNWIKIEKTSLNDIKNKKLDFCYYPISKMLLTGHICSDGVLIIEYDSNEIVKSFKFYSNEEIELTDDYLIKLTPYILSQDKADSSLCD